LVVVVDELHLPPEQSAARVYLLGPQLVRHQRLLSSRGETAGERHAKSDLDRRLGRLRCAGYRAQHACEQQKCGSEQRTPSVHQLLPNWRDRTWTTVDQP